MLLFAFIYEVFLLFPEHKPCSLFFGTIKVEAVTRRILWMKSSDPKAKVLVFSSWNDVLDVLEHALNANEITYIRMKGGR
jgi:E3 ubiquitin-protein ligase SHPRH